MVDKPPDPWGPVARPWLPGTPQEPPLSEIIADSPRDIPEAILTGARPATFAASFLGGPPGVAASFADVESQAAQERRDPEWWERGLAGLGAIPLVGGLLNKARYSDDLVKFAARLARTQPYKERDAYKIAGYAPLANFLDPTYPVVNKDASINLGIENLDELFNAYIRRNMALQTGEAAPPQTELLERFLDVANTVLKEGELADIYKTAEGLKQTYGPKVVDALNKYLGSSTRGMGRLHKAPIEEVANVHFVTNALLDFLGIKDPVLTRTLRYGRPERGISYSMNPYIDADIGTGGRTISTRVPNEELLETFLTGWREAGRTYPSELEFVRLPEGAVGKLDPLDKRPFGELMGPLRETRFDPENPGGLLASSTDPNWTAPTLSFAENAPKTFDAITAASEALDNLTKSMPGWKPSVLSQAKWILDDISTTPELMPPGLDLISVDILKLVADQYPSVKQPLTDLLGMFSPPSPAAYKWYIGGALDSEAVTPFQMLKTLQINLDLYDNGLIDMPLIEQQVIVNAKDTLAALTQLGGSLNASEVNTLKKAASVLPDLAGDIEELIMKYSDPSLLKPP